jgi:hypothetical protein
MDIMLREEAVAYLGIVYSCVQVAPLHNNSPR